MLSQPTIPRSTADRVVLLAAGEHHADKVGVYYSQECIRFLLNCIYSAVYLLNHSEGHKTDRRRGTGAR